MLRAGRACDPLSRSAGTSKRGPAQLRLSSPHAAAPAGNGGAVRSGALLSGSEAMRSGARSRTKLQRMLAQVAGFEAHGPAIKLAVAPISPNLEFPCCRCQGGFADDPSGTRRSLLGALTRRWLALCPWAAWRSLARFGPAPTRRWPRLLLRSGQAVFQLGSRSWPWLRRRACASSVYSCLRARLLSATDAQPAQTIEGSFNSFSGNRMRFDPLQFEARSRYDCKWLSASSWIRARAQLPPCSMNRRLVYSRPFALKKLTQTSISETWDRALQEITENLPQE